MAKARAPRVHARVVRTQYGFFDRARNCPLHGFETLKTRLLDAPYTRPAGDLSAHGAAAPTSRQHGMRNGIRIDADFCRLVDRARCAAGGAVRLAFSHYDAALRASRPSRRTRAMLGELRARRLVPQSTQMVVAHPALGYATALDVVCRHEVTGEAWIIECKSGGSGGANGTFAGAFAHVPVTEHALHLAQAAFERILYIVHTGDDAVRCAVLRADNAVPPAVFFTEFAPHACDEHATINTIVLSAMRNA